MVKFKNIRVKMRGGKSRIQRAMVLASGKLRFVKNISRSRASSSRQPKPKHHRSVRTSMTRRRRGHHVSRGGIMRTAEKVGQLGAFVAPHVDAFLMKKDMNLGVYRLTGYHMATGTWHWQGLFEGWAPGVAFTVAAKAFHKINGLLRRI
jgi:hypothetical protein